MIQKVKLKDIALYSKGKQINKEDLLDDGEYDYLNGGINPSGRTNKTNCEANTITISEGGNSCRIYKLYDVSFLVRCTLLLPL